MLPRVLCGGKEVCEERRGRLLGILLSGLANYRESVRQEAMLVLGQTVFGSSWMECREKKELFALSFRKMLFLFNENKGNELTAFYRRPPFPIFTGSSRSTI